MPEEEAIKRAHEDEREGKSPNTQAGEFVREEMEHIREGEHGGRSPEQAIAIGLSKARRAGVKLAPPKKGTASAKTRKSAARALAAGAKGKKPSRRRSQATRAALKRKGHAAASKTALARQARSAARKRGSGARSAAAHRAAKTRSAARRGSAARKPTRTRSTG